MLKLGSVIVSRSDRRTEVRQETAEHIDVHVDGEFRATCLLRDLSASGAFIETDELELPIGTTIEMYFPLARGSSVNQKALCMYAVVVRITETGFGVMVTSKALVPLQRRDDLVVI